MKRKKKIKVYGKIKLYETSVVGIPAYPDAHFSLTKSLSNYLSQFDDTKLNFGGGQMEVEKQETVQEEKPQEEQEQPQEQQETTQETQETEPEEKTEEKTEEETEESGETEKKLSDLIVKAIKEGLKEGLKETETKRALVSEDKAVEKSLGELALQMSRR